MTTQQQQAVDTSNAPSPIRWLHITDLHAGHANESQQTALASLVEAIEAYSDKPYDLVLVTGDLAYSGEKSQYDALQIQVIDRLRALPICQNSQIISIPGNHDLVCDSCSYPPIWKDLGPSRQKTFFHTDESGRLTRSLRAQAFQQYSEFTKRARIESVDPTTQPAAVINITIRGRTITLISAVTAFFSDKEVSDYQRAPAPVHPIRTILQGLPPETQSIILGHHQMEWFTPETERHLYSLLVEKNALYLHGHEHLIAARFGARGLISLGFGAAYTAPNDSAPRPYYRNSFAICELTDSLHVAIYSWNENGQWRPEQNVPADFIERSERLTSAYRLPLPITKFADPTNRPYSAVASAVRAEVRVEKLIWLADANPKRWTELLQTVGLLRSVKETYAVATQLLPAGHVQFRVKDERGMFLIRAISGHGDILAFDRLQELNTELDRQDFEGCIVVTLGELAGDAETLATQLSQRKPFVVVEGEDLVQRTIRRLPPPLERTLVSLDATLVAASLVVTSTGFGLLIEDRISHAWFQVRRDDGNIVPESDNLVINLRKQYAFLRSTRYEASGVSTGVSLAPRAETPEFDRADYLAKCRAYFDDVRYAPLAALGLRFKKASLSEIYVEASADVGGNSKQSQTLTHAVSEVVEALKLPKAQRDQLDSQLRSRYGLTRTAEVGGASKLYQRYNNVVVLGDPGSGKTCFVKHEILEYCHSCSDNASWYGKHLPIYVSLAEAARLVDERTHLLDICEIVSSRKGIALPRAVIDRVLSEGHAAFFFDGLDEVGYIDKRIALVAEIDELIKGFAARGNRFVLASRPAAVQPVDIPEVLTYLQLKGLTEDEIRILAARVFNARVGDNEDPALEDEEQDLVERLIADTKTSPGIARIARNPLLLTLLVLIYANTGSVSARRHLIYTQAIKTLVSVRGRLTREQQISEADLRTRLGALALGIFQRKISEIPRRSEAVAVLAPLMNTNDIAPARGSAQAADAFIQEVAEATGLLSIHVRNDLIEEDLITFMHYSFLEYYAAAGLLSRDFLAVVPPLSSNPRWKDVITLLFGILSEQGNVTPLLERILEDDTTTTEAISKYKTFLALDCASECDVPPEATQDLLANEIYRTLTQGAGRYSTDVRNGLARRLEYFLFGAGPRIEPALCKGLREGNAVIAATFADLIARFGETITLSDRVIEAFEVCLEHKHPVTRGAALHAIERRPELRSEKSRDVVRESLSGSLVEKHAALKAISAVPAYLESMAREVRDLLDDPSPLIAGIAAQCVLVNEMKGRKWNEHPASLDKVLGKLQQGDEESGFSVSGITLDRQMLEPLIFSGNALESELAVRFVPLIRNDEQFAYQALMQRFRTAELSRHKAACLDSIRGCPGAIDLITIGDTDLICSEMKAQDRNVRVAVLKLLGEMPDDEQVIQSLRNHLIETAGDVSRYEEMREAAKALAKHVGRNQRLRAYVLKSIVDHLPKSPKRFGDSRAQQHIVGLLLVCESIGGVTDDVTAQRLNRLAQSFRTPEPIRRLAMRVFGRLAEPSIQNMGTLIELLSKDNVVLNESLYVAASYFVSQCRRRVDFVRAVYGALPRLREQLRMAWQREVRRAGDSIEPAGLRYIRDASVEVEDLMVAYEEFSDRATIAQ